MYDPKNLKGADISTTFCGIKLQSPYILTSGPLTYAAEGMIRGHNAGCGAVVTKTIRLGAAINPIFHIADLQHDSIINCEKWADSEREVWYEREIPMTKKAGAVVIGSVGHTPEEARAIVADVEKAGADIIELVSYAEETLLPMLEYTLEHVNIPVICKLSGNWPDPVGTAKKCMERGAQGIAAIDSIGPTLQIDINKRAPSMYSGNGYGWMSGAAIKPISMRINAEIAMQHPGMKNLYGSGGCMSAEDAIEFMMAGCTGVGVCTVGILRDVEYVEEMCYDLSRGLAKLGYKNAEEVVGAALGNFPKREYIGHLDFTYDPDYAPCQQACPAGVNVPQYIEDVRRGNYEEAYKRVSLVNPFPAVCGRVCDHPCEAQCRRGERDDAIEIRLLKRTASDKTYEKYGDELPIPPVKAKNGKKVAVIGAGPAGLSAAYYLAKEGYGVKVLESQPTAGGMLAVGIPDYRLPRDILAKEVKRIERMGVEIACNSVVDKAAFDGLTKDFDRVLVAVGAHGDAMPDIPGVEKGVSGIAFLRDVSQDKAESLSGKSVAVIGGGNVAVDAARSALRLGAADVTIYYRRTRAEMPAYAEEIAHALEEGVKLVELAAPHSIGEGFTYEPMKLGEADESGRRRPVPSGDAPVAVKADRVILAIGQKVAADFVPGVKENEFTADGKVYVAGDCLYGPASVIKAIASGRDAAVAIDKELLGHGLVDADEQRELRLAPIAEAHADAQVSPVVDAPTRKKSFTEVELGLGEYAARTEAERCLKCGCINCGRCVAVCPYDARTLNFPVMKVDDNECRKCGMCASICPTGALKAFPAPQSAEDEAEFEKSQAFYAKYATAH